MFCENVFVLFVFLEVYAISDNTIKLLHFATEAYCSTVR